MDEIIYQCPECNFNADNLTELDDHIIDNHSNETRNNDKHMDTHIADDDDDVVADETVYQDDEFDDLLIDSEIPVNSTHINNHTINDEKNDTFYDDYENENQLTTETNHLPINKPHNLRAKQPIDYNHLNGTSSADTNKNHRSQQPLIPTQLNVNSTSETNPIVPVINSGNHYERQYNCKSCEFFTNNPRAVLYHRKEFHLEKINIYECSYCQYASQYSGKVERHTLLRHKINNSATKRLTIKGETDINNQSSLDLTLNMSSIGNETNISMSVEHPKQELNVAKFQCDKCPCKYKRSNDLFNHLKSKHAVQTPRLNDYLIQTHENNNNMNNQYEEEEDLFNENNFKDENKPTSYECPYCAYYSNGNDAEYLLHVKEHLCGKSFRCVLCNSAYKYRGDCVVHLKRKHQNFDLYAHNYVERFNLDTIDISQVCVLLKPKQQQEAENEEKLFGCSYCDFKANYKGDVVKHQSRRHPGSPRNIIALNSQMNLSSNNLSYVDLNRSKSRVTSNLVQETYEDHQTDNDIVELDSNEQETDYYNNNNQEYNDDEDLFQEDYNNTTNYNDQNDLEIINDEEDYYQDDSQTTQQKTDDLNQRFQCKFCSFVAKNHAKLQLHLATHYNLKPFMCPICNRRANFKWDIQKHIRKIHNDYTSEVIRLSETEARQTISSYIEGKQPLVFDNNVKRPASSLSPLSSNNSNKLEDDLESNNLRSITRPAALNGNLSLNTQTNGNSTLGYLNKTLPTAPTASCSDPTGNKKFKCTVCPYRSNWKADLFRHLRKRHFVLQPQLENVIILDSEYAVSSLEEYEQVHGINVRKRSRTDLDIALDSSNINNGSSLNDNKRTKYNADQDSEIDSTNQQENNNEFTNRTDRLPVNIAELNIRPYKCLKCGFRSDRKSDTLRHIRVKHFQTENTVKFLRIMSIKEASDTIEAYENMRLYKKIKSFNSDAQTNIYEEANIYEMNDEAPVSNVIQPDTFEAVETETKTCCGLYRCPFCSFNNVSKFIMRRHLAIHFSDQIVKTHPMFRCSICTFKSKWKFNVKKHIVMNHLSVQNALVLKVVNKKQSNINGHNDILPQIVEQQHETKPLKKELEMNEFTEHEEQDQEEYDHEQEEFYENESAVNGTHNYGNETTMDGDEDEEDFYYQSNGITKEDNDSYLIDDKSDESQRKTQTISLTGYDGAQFESTFQVSHPLQQPIDQQNGFKKKVYYCLSCPYKTSNYSHLKQHLLQHRFQEGYFQCRYCSYYVSKVRLLKQHEILHPEFELRLTAKQQKQQKSAMDH